MGLTQLPGSYKEVINCLQKHYNSSCLIHQVHFRAIVNATSLKDRHGPKWRKLHKFLNQHLRVLKAMKYGPLGPFITLLIETKLNRSMMFDWQMHTQENSDVPHYAEILEFMDLQVRDSKMVLRESPKCHSQPLSKNSTPIRTTYVANVDMQASSLHVVQCQEEPFIYIQVI